MRGCATFYAVTPAGSGTPSLVICTAYPSQDGTELHQVFDDPFPRDMAIGQRRMMETAMMRALDAGGGYPMAEGQAMAGALPWDQGLAGLLSARSGEGYASIKLTFTPDTCGLLPELVPVELPDGTQGWLDMIAAVFRTITKVEQPVVRRWKDASLAIVYEIEREGVFERIAETVHLNLRGSLEVDTFRGSEFPRQLEQRVLLLHQVFRQHSAVLFLGHPQRPGPGHGGGWMLSEDAPPLLMSEIRNFLKGRGTSVPEVVFSASCVSAGSDPKGEWSEELLYPKLFLDAGVRFFIGTSMDIVIPHSSNTGAIEELLCAFFRSWAADRDGAVEHLYGAKRDSGFPLVSSVFQIYAAAGEQSEVHGGRAPTGAVVSGITEGDCLGPYLVGPQVWGDRYARTFRAESQDAGSVHLVQVLADEWQGSATAERDLQAALRKLQAAQLSPGHLVPSRCETVPLLRGGRAMRSLHVLVYDRPAGEKPDVWTTLSGQSTSPQTPEGFMEVLRLGADVSSLLRELHGKRILHGNLDPGNIVILNDGGLRRTMLKDAWVRQAKPGRCTKGRYAAPEEASEGESGTELKYDCWSLGVVLFELAAGELPFREDEAPEGGLPRGIRDVRGSGAADVPEALDRIVRECLVPSAEVRPSAESIARRLYVALNAGGVYLGEFEQRLDMAMQAGHRFFAVAVDDVGELEQALTALSSREHPRLPANAASGARVRYRLYIAAEDRGLVDCRQARAVVRWGSATEADADRAAQAARQGLPTPPPLGPVELGRWNGYRILSHLPSLAAGDAGATPIVLIVGGSWWDYGLGAWRILRNCQEGGARGPVVIIADNRFTIPAGAASGIEMVRFPPPAPALLFERILGFARNEGMSVPDVAPEMAIRLAVGFYPCSMREVRYALRMCALEHGCIDDRALNKVEEAREQEFAAVGTARYVPVSKLAAAELMGLPRSVESQVAAWCEAVRASEHEPSDSVPQRLLVCGDAGCGKTSLARRLAKRLGRPLVSIDVLSCLRGMQGESEGTVRETLRSAAALHRVLVLLEDLDRLSAPPAAGAGPSSLEAIMLRMGSVVLHWLDAVPSDIVVVMTARDPSSLTAQWRRRADQVLTLPQPVGDEDYRASVFAAVFRGCGLDALAQDKELTLALASRTDPVTGAPVPSPWARASSDPGLGTQLTRLETGADVKAWVHETLLMYGHRSDVRTAGFWRGVLALDG